MHGTGALVIFLCTLASCAASYCYPDYCQNVTKLEFIPGFQCLLTRPQINEECRSMNFKDVNHVPPKESARFKLSAYVTVPYHLKHKLIQSKTVAFNLSVTDINFHRLVLRYQNLGDKETSSCRYVNLYGNDTYDIPKEFYVSCPHFTPMYGGASYNLQYLVIGETYNYSRKYDFIIPKHENMDDSTDIKQYTPFIYVDVWDPSFLILYIQPLPKKFNVSQYRTWLIDRHTNSAVADIVIPVPEDNEHIQYKFTVYDGQFYFNVAALHPNCSEYGCVNSTSPFLITNGISNKLLIMIISIIWIPPVILYAVYYVYKLHRKRKIWERTRGKPKCLLIYSPTHTAHANTMIDLTKYLRCCGINAMIDTLDIPETVSKDPGLWCDDAFYRANIVLIATSPSTTKSDVPTVYRNTDHHLMRLVKENYPQRNKDYYALQFPYCKPEDLPEEARYFRRFRMPEDLIKLVKTIHGSRNCRFFGVSDREFVQSIRTAQVEIEEETNNPKIIEETDDLLSAAVDFVLKTPSDDQNKHDIHGESSDSDVPEGTVIPQFFTTNIAELNLLGENGENEKSIIINPTAKNFEFRIDKLDL